MDAFFTHLLSRASSTDSVVMPGSPFPLFQGNQHQSVNVFLQIRNVSFHWEAVPTLERSRADGALRATFCYHRDDLMSALLSSLLCLGQPWAGASFQHRLGQEEDGHTRAIKAVKFMPFREWWPAFNWIGKSRQLFRSTNSFRHHGTGL